jgi:hypothetical protein
MSYFDEASLVMIPSGYKDQKVYSVKPLDGAGDLTFSRASSATRVASNGLIEKVRTNLLTYSNDFSNAAWTKVGGTTLTAGQADYLGGTNAWKWEATGVSTIQLAQNPAGATIRTSSIYAKAGSVSTLNLWIGSAVTFNLSTGTVTSGTGVITSVGNGWYRCSAFGIGVSHNPYFASATAGDYVLISFAQLEEVDIATDYIATTTTAVSVGPVSGLPRLDYLNSSCPRLLLEGQRTSNVQFSEAFDNAYWTKTNVTLTSTLGGPIDQSKYFTITCNGTAGTFKGVGKTFFNTSPNTYSLSVFAKAGNSSTFVVSSRATLTTNDVRAIFNLSNGTITSTNGGTAAIVPYGDGWYRCSFTVVNAGTFTDQSSIFFGHPFGAADGATVLATGAMSEIGAHPSSYIPTLSTSVTRVADAASKTGISSLIGQTEGTVFVEVDYSTLSGLGMFLSIRPDASNKVEVYRDGGIIYGELTASSSFSITATKAVGTHKIAFAYKSGSSALYIDGVLAGESTTSFAFTSSLVDIAVNARIGGTFNEAANYKQLLLFPTRLSNSDLAALTA